MGEVIKFPDSDERHVTELNALLDELIVGHAPEFKECLKRDITPAYLKLARLPSYEFSLSLDAENEEKTFKEIKKHMKEYALMVQKPLLNEIIMMIAERCHREISE